MTKDEVNFTIAKLAKDRHFYTRSTSYTALGLDIGDIDNDVCFTIHDSCDIDIDAKQIIHRITLTASIGRMDFNATPDELLATAERIKSAAELCIEVNNEELFYVDQF